MGSSWSVKLVAAPEGLARGEVEGIDREIRDVLAELERLMSTWDSTSELSRFNAFRGSEGFPVSAATFEVFDLAISLADATGGALDVTVLPVVEAWGFGAAEEVRPLPDESELMALQATTGLAHLELDPVRRTVRKLRADVRCDFSAVAPGYAADRLAALLAAHNLSGFLVDVGGELVARGHGPGGAPWRVAIERPERLRKTAARVVPMKDAAIATSGDYRNYREIGDRRLSHIMDPRTARPVDHALVSATVIDASCARADGLATALMVLGPDEGMAMARRLGLAALLVVRNERGGFEERTTPRFDALVGAS